jgi:Zn-dependent M16 (insulinase) family peptidase
MKQTAVEWFNDEILIHLNFDQRLYLKDIFEQAKEMEKEQICDAINKFAPVVIDAEDYYNETFKSK